MRELYIDIHTHILPGLDDGAENAEDTVAMAAISADNGVGIIVATPHSFGNECFGGTFRDEVFSALDFAQSEIDAAGIPVRLLSGMEIYATDETAELLTSGDLLTINETKYALIEFDFEERARRIYDILKSVFSAGFIPIVAHPERYTCISEDIGVARELVSHGCLLQINKGSLAGSFGTDAMKSAISLIGGGLATCVASDAHSPYRRTTSLREARDTINELFSSDVTEKLLRVNPLKILKGEPVNAFQGIK